LTKTFVNSLGISAIPASGVVPDRRQTVLLL